MLNHLRLATVAATAAVAALTLTGCGTDKTPATDKAPAPSASASAPAASASTGGGAKGGTLEGGWVSLQNPGKGVVLTVKGQVAFVVEGATGLTCQGTTDGAAITLKCPQGATRSHGKVDSVNATTLKVTWEGAGTDTFQRSEPGKLPSLPANLPTSLG
ncbi:hypothetical protein ACIOD1_04575 [Streptomyces sp. NPDC088097]|uniref:hypothetical protein n=1 Tax=Streptomyces sp. NPDC088097 TaxID=3365823 RepID=UPI00381FB238